jgi:hypothetical protein
LYNLNNFWVDAIIMQSHLPDIKRAQFKKKSKNQKDWQQQNGENPTYNEHSLL